MIYRFRIILDNDTEDDVFRDIEIRETDTMEDLHNVITQSFGFDGMEMASFYMSDEQWNQGEEIAMMDMSEAGNEVKMMSTTIIKDMIHEASTRLIYLYDFMNMWTFYVELGEIVEEAEGTDYPNLMYVHGQIPDQAPEKTFKADEDEDDLYNEFEDDLDPNDYDNLNFDENWN
ncbi:plasmid pRiA4b ORF-3 family protein [Winogradskyella psychrotolerans]|uniref:plasmid pRiA4b ORF-3 family protein n=1 Tax=Winogradskyella psychrotolerans TaxID=1344585 RepID=UPI001C0754B8|nr:plasmid pRiA4b ORF-3 family protein [Winogradskyella psychrotolerans]MBU2920907.1 plasmid pRiA4b ORF-3 family protein [Winogradskyella psychrotolerans]